MKRPSLRVKSGEFYPKNIKTARDRLQYYATYFNSVEVDSSYYAVPDSRTVWLWAQRTPGDFIFHIKAYGALTGHGVDPRSLPRDILQSLPDEKKNKKFIYVKAPDILKHIAERFVGVLNLLWKTGKLIILVFQFPQWFHYNPANLDYIIRCKSLMDGLPLAVEFRHGSWLAPDRKESVLHFLEKNQITYITVDEPQYGSLATVPFVPYVTTNTAYSRFHGRNKQNWLKKGIETSLRYDYFYSDNELREFIPSFERANKKAQSTFAMFNNCHGGFAVKDAMRLEELMKKKEETEEIIT
ncbi:MAG: DUF72 domain-containing protein [Thermodesulfovibrionia bacterium]|nr:DUF72 domain-containing protein [Thermodesulfovibrionia bacterium]